MRTALRTALAATLVAGVAITAPALGAGAAFAADGPAGAASVPSAPAPAASAPAPGASGASGAQQSDAKPGDAKPSAGTTAGGEASAVTPTGAPADPAKGVLVRTETLLGGTVAKIYRVNALHHRAELFHRGNPVGVVDANTRPAAGNDNGEFFVLFENGTTYNWNRAYLPGAAPGLYELADGTRLQLAEKDGRLGLQLVENGKGRGYTYLNGLRQVWTYGKAIVVLERDGGFAAYIRGGARQAAPRLVESPAPGPGPVVTIGECTVRQDIPSVFALLTVTLTNDLEKGPKAVLKDEAGKAVVTVDRAHSADLGQGLTIKGADTATPRLGQRTQGGDTPYRWTAFPKLPEGCAKDSGTPTTTPTTTPAGNTGTTVNTAGQTTVVPKGGVAAGAEFGTADDSGALLATGAGAASLAAAGLGFVVLRRRAAARV
ncbi:hypothetical protein [Streptomyces sp. NPDC059247]|uniref:hypothetical protein n=1 Tax=Streptomyces sp. NPDC059247 TaxID=3346790 RepID=UPI00367E3EBB